jgi:hypothetical protein
MKMNGKRMEMEELELEATRLTGIKPVKDYEYVKIRYKQGSEKSGKIIRDFYFRSSSGIL